MHKPKVQIIDKSCIDGVIYEEGGTQEATQQQQGQSQRQREECDL